MVLNPFVEIHMRLQNDTSWFRRIGSSDFLGAATPNMKFKEQLCKATAIPLPLRFVPRISRDSRSRSTPCQIEYVMICCQLFGLEPISCLPTPGTGRLLVNADAEGQPALLLPVLDYSPSGVMQSFHRFPNIPRYTTLLRFLPYSGVG